MIKPIKILVVGGSAAGPAAAAKAKRVNRDAQVLMFEAGNFISTGTCEIPYVLSNEIKDYNQLINFTPKSFKEKKGVDVFTNHFVEEINRRKKIIIVKNLKENKLVEFNYDKLILTTGSNAKIPGLFNLNYENVFTLKNIDDYLKINNYLNHNKISNVCIFGSGYLGLEAAEALKLLGYNVCLIEKEKLPLPDSEPEIQHLLKELLEQNNVRFFGAVNNPQIVAEENKIKRINANERILETDLILLTTGFLPNNSLAEKSKLNIGKYGGIEINRKLQTSDFNIFAAGDNIEVQNFITKKSEYIPLATIARDYGHSAGENAAGGNVRVEPIVKNIGVKIFNKFFVLIGLTSYQANEHKFNFASVNSVESNLVESISESEKVFGKIIYEKSTKKVLGASFLGGREVSGYGDLISSIIRSNQTADFLAKINYNYSPPLSPFKNILSVLGRKIN